MAPREQHEEMMRRALAAADAAATHGDVPVGAVVVSGGEVVGAGHNRREIDQDPTAHAEILAIRAAAVAAGTWHLTEATLYVTQEPCPMCAGAIVNARIPRLVFGCLNPKAGSVRTLYALCEDPRLNHRVEVTGGVLADECGLRLRSFFEQLRTGRDGREVEGA
jgi:tRNA(adenine34) deaminase